VPRPRWDIGTRVADHHLRALRQDVRGGRLDPARQHLGDLADTGGRPGEVGGKFESLRLVAAVFDAVGGGDGLIELAVPDTQLGELPLEALTRPRGQPRPSGPAPRRDQFPTSSPGGCVVAVTRSGCYVATLRVDLFTISNSSTGRGS
jgi:hypothetical protein